jgi:type III restriction enzyme
MKAGLPNNAGRHTLSGPGSLVDLGMNPYRKGRRLQALSFELARDITRDYLRQSEENAPAHVLFAQVVAIALRYLREKIIATPPADPLDVFLSPYYGWVIERLVEAIKPDSAQGEPSELPRYESNRPPGSTTDVDFWTSRDVREVINSHLNYVVADTEVWEQSAAYAIDKDKRVESAALTSDLGLKR